MTDPVRLGLLYLQIDGSAQRGDLEAAEAACRELLQLAPQQAPAWSCLGTIALARGAANDAVAALRKAVSLAPNDAGHWSTLAAAESSLGRHAEALQAFERCLALAPDRPDDSVAFAQLLCKRGQPSRALSVLNETVQRSPTFAPAWIGIATVHVLLKSWDETIAACRRAVALAPQAQDARLMWAVAFMKKWLLPEAESLARELLASDPAAADAWSLLGTVLKMQGRADEGIEALRQAFALAPDPHHHSVLLQSMQYVAEVSPQLLLEAHRKWDAKHAGPGAPASRPASHSREASRPLKLGFVSAEFGLHATTFLALPLLESLDKSRCSVTCYSDRPEEDSFTSRFRAAADAWHNTSAWTSRDIAEQVRRDKIDILVDLMGHTGERLPVFAGKPAPLQVTWLGYVGTTGLSAMDFLLADRFHVRQDEEVYYSEKVLRMPNGYVCYSPLADLPQVNPLPALDGGRNAVTFGCFNNPAKYHRTLLRAWAQILSRAPRSRLLLKYGGLDHPQIRARLHAEFADHGVAPERIVTEGWCPMLEMPSHYGKVDLALDTQPYSGGVTTCEALWMGVSVITFPGKTFAGRHSTSHLSNAGYGQFVAQNWEDYVELAVKWANQLNELAIIRSQLREQVRRSPLFDAPRFANDFLDVLANAWIARL